MNDREEEEKREEETTLPEAQEVDMTDGQSDAEWRDEVRGVREETLAQKRQEREEELAKFEREKLAATEPRAEVPFLGTSGRTGTEVHTGRYVTKADFEAGQKEIDDYAARQRERREEERRARNAAAAKREELLASGDWYDDGRGNLRQKKLNKGFGRYAPARGTAGNRGWLTADAMYRSALGDAQGQTTASQPADIGATARRVQTAEAASREQWRQELAEKKHNDGLSGLARFSGLSAARRGVAAMFDENGHVLDEGSVTEGARKAREGDKDGNGRDARFTWAQGADGQWRATGLDLNAKVKTGKRYVSYALMPATIREINGEMLRSGERGMAITGIIARAEVDANGNAKGRFQTTADADGNAIRSFVPEVHYYYQWRDAKGVKHGGYMDDRMVYRLGLEANAAAGEKDADAATARDFFDLYGNAAKRSLAAAVAGREQAAKMRKAEAEARVAGKEKFDKGLADALATYADSLEYEEIVDTDGQKKKVRRDYSKDSDGAEALAAAKKMLNGYLAKFGMADGGNGGRKGEGPTEQQKAELERRRHNGAKTAAAINVGKMDENGGTPETRDAAMRLTTSGGKNVDMTAADAEKIHRELAAKKTAAKGAQAATPAENVIRPAAAAKKPTAEAEPENGQKQGGEPQHRYTQAWEDIPQKDKPFALLHKGVRAFDRAGNAVGKFLTPGENDIALEREAYNFSKDAMQEAKRRSTMTDREIRAEEAKAKFEDQIKLIAAAEARQREIRSDRKNSEQTRKDALRKEQAARNLRKLYESGDEDGVRELIAADSELKALLEEAGL